MDTFEIKLEDIDAEALPNSRNDLGDIADLARSLESIGQQQPIIVRSNEERSDSKVELVAGFRRYAAAVKLGWEKIRVIDLDDASLDEAMRVTWHENFGRLQLTPIEEARFFERYQKQFLITRKALAKELAVPEGRVRDRMKLLTYPPLVQEQLGKEDGLRQADLAVLEPFMAFPFLMEAIVRLAFPDKRTSEWLIQAAEDGIDFADIRKDDWRLRDALSLVHDAWIDEERQRDAEMAEGKEGGDVPGNSWPWFVTISQHRIPINADIVAAGDSARSQLVYTAKGNGYDFQRWVANAMTGVIDNARAAGVLCETGLGGYDDGYLITDYEWYWAQIEAAVAEARVKQEEDAERRTERGAGGEAQDGSYVRPPSAPGDTHAPPAQKVVSANSVAARNARWVAFQQNQQFGANLFTKSGVDEISTADMKMVATLFLLSKTSDYTNIDAASWNLAHVWPGMNDVIDKGKNEKAYKVGSPRPADAREWIWRVLAEAKSPEQVMRLLRAIVTATQFRHDDMPRSGQLNRGLPSVYGESSEHATELHRCALLDIRSLAQECMPEAMLAAYDIATAKSYDHDVFRSAISMYAVRKPEPTPEPLEPEQEEEEPDLQEPDDRTADPVEEDPAASGEEPDPEPIEL